MLKTKIKAAWSKIQRAVKKNKVVRTCLQATAGVISANVAEWAAQITSGDDLNRVTIGAIVMIVAGAVCAAMNMPINDKEENDGSSESN